MSGAGLLVWVVCFDADLVEAGELHNDIMIETAISAVSVAMKVPAYGLNEFDQTVECLIHVQFGKLVTRICSHHRDTILLSADSYVGQAIPGPFGRSSVAPRSKAGTQHRVRGPCQAHYCRILPYVVRLSDRHVNQGNYLHRGQSEA